MDYLRRLHCHHCGARTSHSRASKVQQLYCKVCDAWTYFDENGDVTDAPSSVTSNVQAPYVRFSTSPSPPPGMDQPKASPFCSTCEHNQRIYLETLSNYLPDDDHPRYHEFERALPKFKADLEKRYPQICTKCAPKAQSVIHRADYQAGTRNVGRLCDETQKRRAARKLTGQRDDWHKRLMRTFYTLLSLALHISLLIQCAWHVYGIFLGKLRMGLVTFDSDLSNDELVFDNTPRTCLQHSLRLQFTRYCYLSLAEYVFWALRVSAALSWYNPGRKAWYHPTHRFGAVTGQTQYFYMQLILFAVRGVGLWKLSDASIVRGLTVQQFNGAHASMILFMVAIQMLANRTIQAVLYKHNFKITPTVDDVNIFAGIAGPASEKFSPRASATHPSKLFARDDPRPFPIWNLAPQQQQQQKAAKYPSPPLSSAPWETEYDDDAMDIDWQSSSHSGMPGAPVDRQYRPIVAVPEAHSDHSRSLYNHTSTQPSGWGALRNETFRLQGEMEAEKEVRRREEEERIKLQYQPPVQQTPFRGRLPPAPMSMERRLRNPVTQVQFKKTPLSKQQNFMQQMREGIDNAKTFAITKEMEQQQNSFRDKNEDDDESSVFSFAANRTKGSLDLKQSTWKLPGDGETATGLEELFGGISFRIAEEAAIAPEPATKTTGLSAKLILGIVLPIGVAALSWLYTPLRRTICLWLVGKLEDFGIA